MVRFVVGLVLLLTLGAQSFAAVWETRQSWSPTMEEQYSKWVGTNWTLDILSSEDSPYGRIVVDCADAVYAMRIIFAFEQGLPFAMRDPTGGSRTITNQMTRFDSIADSHARLRAFLRFVFSVGSTQSLPADTYPVAVNRESVRAGGLILELEKRHSFTIKAIESSGQPLLYYSTTSNQGPLLIRRSLPSVEWLFPNGVRAPSGIRWFRQPADLGLSEWQVPNSSQEQYSIPLASWREEVVRRLALSSETSEARAERLFQDACLMSQFRMDVVKTAVRAQANSRCFSAVDYDNLSTPSRDRQLAMAFADLLRLGPVGLDPASYWGSILALMTASDLSAEGDEELQKLCPLSPWPGVTLSLREVRVRLAQGKMSSNPNEGWEQRWGFRIDPSERAQRCPKY